MAGLMLNEDDSHFFCGRPVEKLTREGVYELVDHYISPPMRELIFNVNAMRANFPSRAWQTVWDGFDPAGGLDQPRLAKLPAEWREPAYRRFLKLPDLDIPQYWIERVRHHGKSPWLSVRMNDIHDVDRIDQPSHSDFWRNHPEYWRVPDAASFREWTDRALDYGHEAVRDRSMGLIRELFDRYDFDGLELDWMRFPLHFRPGFEEEGRRLLLAFHREVRTLAERHARRRGHPIRIGVRVPSRPDTARAIGLDAVAWAREGLVDLVVITPFWVTIEFDMPVELWKDLLGDRVTLAAGLEENLSPSPKVWPKHSENLCNSADTVLGAAAALLYRGADRIYLFNYMDSGGLFHRPGDYHRVLNLAGDLSSAASGPRRHVVTYSDVQAPGEPAAHALPVPCSASHPARFRIPIGPRPVRGDAQVIVGLGEGGDLDVSALTVRVNGTRCCPGSHPLPSPIHPVVRKAQGFEIPGETLHDGYNYLEVTSSSPQAREIFWMEIMIQPAG